MATTDYFLEIDGVDGESLDSQYQGKVEVQHLSYGVRNAGTAGRAGGAGSGASETGDFAFTKYVDKSTPVFFKSCATGTHFPTAVIHCRRAGGDEQQEYLTIKLSEVFVSSHTISGANGGDSSIPTENFSLNFSKIEWTYTPQTDSGGGGGAVTQGYDFGARKAT